VPAVPQLLKHTQGAGAAAPPAQEAPGGQGAPAAETLPAAQ
jgi:hypothetical protein